MGGGFRPVVEQLALSAGTQSTHAGTVVFADGGGVSFGMTGSSQVTASVGAGATATGNLGALVASGGTATSGTVSFQNGNGISFGQSVQRITASFDGLRSVSASGGAATGPLISLANANGVSFGVQTNASVVTASVGAGATATGNLGGLAAGGVTATSGTVLLAASNGVSFGLSGSSQLTASVATSTISYFENYKAMALAPNGGLPAGVNSNLSLQRVFIPWHLTATQADLLGALTASGSASGAYTLRLGLYSYDKSTASLLWTGSAAVSFVSGSNTSSGYAAYASTRFRSITFGSQAVTPGEYMVGLLGSIATSGTMTLFGQSSVSVLPYRGPAGSLSYWGDGLYSASTTNLPASIVLSQLVQTGAAPLRQPYFRLVGTF